MATTDQAGELATLRAQIDQLQEELAEQTARSNAAMAATQQRMQELSDRRREDMAEMAGLREQQYWLERWDLDLNALMERRSVRAARVLFVALRKAVGIASEPRRSR